MVHTALRLNFSSCNCLSPTGDGAPAIRSCAWAVFGKAMTSRIECSPHRMATDPVEAERDAAVRRGAVLERVDEEPETQSGFLVGDLQQLEDQSLDGLVVNPDAAAGDLAAVQHEIVGARPRPPLVGLEQRRRRSRAAR